MTSSHRRTRVGLVVAVTIAGVLGGLAPVGAADKVGRVTEFSAGVNPGPFGITVGPDGNLWFTQFGNVGIDPDTGQSNSGGGGIGRITPKGEVTEFAAGLSPFVQPGGITAGPDHNLWFGEAYERRVGRITPDGVITEFSTDTIVRGVTPENVGVTAGPDGNLWYNDYDGIGRVTPDGAMTAFPAGGYPTGVPVAGPDGNLWFIGTGIGRITPGGEFAEFTAGLTGPGRPDGITAGPDGNLWFIGYAGESALIGRITPDGVITEFSAGLTAGAQPQEITSGPDGNLWFTEFDEQRIGRITPEGVITEFSKGISASASPSGLTVGCDGNLWFSEYDELNQSGANRIGRITAKGKVSEFSKGITGGPSGLTAGPDGNVWFTETQAGQIGRISAGPPAKARGRRAPTLPAVCQQSRG